MEAHTDVSKNVKMRGGLGIETWIFLGLTVFFAAAAVVYGIVAGRDEPVGVVGLSLTAGLTLIIGTFLRFAGRRLEAPRPEDNDDAEISDGAGDLGFFSPGSYWPFTLALTAAVFAVATAFLLIWLMIIAIVFLLMAVVGFLFEYHRRPQTAH